MAINKKIKYSVANIQKQKKRIESKIDQWENALVILQDEMCPHEKLTYKNEGSSGNWDNEEYYWRDWKCYICGKRWTTDQTYESETKYPHAIDITNIGYEGKNLLEKTMGIKLEG